MFGDFNFFRQSQQSDIVDHVARVVIFVDEDFFDSNIDVPCALLVVGITVTFRVDVVLTKANFQQLPATSQASNAVRG